MISVSDLKAGEMLQWYARYREAYSKYCCRAIIKEPFSPNEMNLLIFLSNNPQMDTAKELTVTLGVSKGLICRSVGSLTQKGYLRGEVDKRDRRIVHLMLTDKAAPIIQLLQENRAKFSQWITQEISQSDLETYKRVNKQLIQNIQRLADVDLTDQNDSQ